LFKFWGTLCVLEPPPPSGLGTTYDVHLVHIVKRIVDFILVIERFSLGVTAGELRANIGSKSAISLQRGPVDPKFQVEGVAPTNHSSSQKTKLNAFSYGIKISTDFFSVLLQSTRLSDIQTDRLTERILIATPRLHSMQRSKKCYFFKSPRKSI